MVIFLTNSEEFAFKPLKKEESKSAKKGRLSLLGLSYRLTTIPAPLFYMSCARAIS
jgi:hypothetical protein